MTNGRVPENEISEEDFEEHRTPPARIGHEFQEPIVEELRRETPHPRRQADHRSEETIAETKNGRETG